MLWYNCERINKWFNTTVLTKRVCALHCEENMFHFSLGRRRGLACFIFCFLFPLCSSILKPGFYLSFCKVYLQSKLRSLILCYVALLGEFFLHGLNLIWWEQWTLLFLSQRTPFLLWKDLYEQNEIISRLREWHKTCGIGLRVLFLF